MHSNKAEEFNFDHERIEFIRINMSNKNALLPGRF